MAQDGFLRRLTQSQRFHTYLILFVTWIPADLGGLYVHKYAKWTELTAGLILLFLAFNSVIILNSLTGRNDLQGKIGFVIGHIPLVLFVLNVLDRTGGPSPVVIISTAASVFSWFWWVKRSSGSAPIRT